MACRLIPAPPGPGAPRPALPAANGMRLGAARGPLGVVTAAAQAPAAAARRRGVPGRARRARPPPRAAGRPGIENAELLAGDMIALVSFSL